VSDALEQARAHVQSRVAATDDQPIHLSESRGPGGFTVVRAALRGSYPGTGVAVALVSPGGRVYGKGTGNDLAELLDELGFDPSPPGARLLAELVALICFDGLVTVLDDSPPTASITGDGVRLEAVVRGALARRPDQLMVIIPDAGAPTIDRTPITAEAPAPIDRAVALERALDSGDAMAVQRALRAMSGTLTEREMTVIARVALEAGGPVADQARRRLGDGPAAQQAFERARDHS
jgi:hypothetical protein